MMPYSVLDVNAEDGTKECEMFERRIYKAAQNAERINDAVP